MPTRLVPNSDERTNLSPEERRQARKRSYRLLREILRPHRLSLAISVAAVILGAIASAVQPWLIARVLDTAIEPLTRGDSAPLIFFVVLFGATVLANGTLTWVNVVYTVRVSLGVLLSLRTRVFQHSQSLSVSFHESYTSGRVISRLTSDIDTIRTFLDSGISQLATTLLGIAFSVIAIFLLDWRIGLLLVAMTVPIWLITRWFRTRSETAFRAMRNESAQLTSRFVETYTGIRAIKSFGAEADARASYARNAERAATPKTLIRDMTAEPGAKPLAKETVDDYTSVLEDTFILEEIGPWAPHLRSPLRISKKPKYHFVDPSIPAALLKLTPEKLLGNFETFGFLFESLCMRDLLVYAQSQDGDVYFYRDRDDLEVDAIVEAADGAWAGIEVKIGHNQAEKAAANLLRLSDKIRRAGGRPPAFLLVLEGLGDYAYRRTDGVYVAPIAVLAP